MVSIRCWGFDSHPGEGCLQAECLFHAEMRPARGALLVVLRACRAIQRESDASFPTASSAPTASPVVHDIVDHMLRLPGTPSLAGGGRARPPVNGDRMAGHQVWYMVARRLEHTSTWGWLARQEYVKSHRQVPCTCIRPNARPATTPIIRCHRILFCRSYVRRRSATRAAPAKPRNHETRFEFCFPAASPVCVLGR